MMAFTRRPLPAELARYQDWPDADLSCLEGAARSRYGEIKQAIEAYIDGREMKAKLIAIKLSHAEMLRRLNRCVSFDRRGRIIGWPAILPCQRLKSYERTEPTTAREPLAKGGYSGALTHLFTVHPSILQRISAYVLTGSREGSVPESRVTPKAAHEYLLALCRKEGLGDDDWPFCVEGLGERAIAKWFHGFNDANSDLITDQQYGKDAQAKRATGRGVPSRLKARLPFDVVEMDEHTLDFIGTVGIPTPKGPVYVPMKRMVVVLVVDRFSQAVLAYHVIVRRKVNSADIIKTVAKAVTQWCPRAMSLTDFKGASNGGFPSERIPALANCGFNLLLMDNDSAHLAEPVLSRIGFIVGCAINYGKVAHFERRPFVESLNKRLEAAGFHRLPSTTGKGPKDPRRKEAEAKALKFKIHLDAILDLVEAVVADHNASRPAGNYGRTPLELLQQYVEDPSFGFLAPIRPPHVAGMPPLSAAIETVTVGGKRESGDRAHIYLDRARYEAPWLSERTDLIGRDVTAHLNEDDIESFHVFTQTGTFLGVVHATGAWAGHPHSREARRLIKAAVKSGQLSLRKGESVVAEWLRLLAKDALAKSGTEAKPAVSDAANKLAEEARLGNVRPDSEAGKARSAPEASENATVATSPPVQPNRTVASTAATHTLAPVVPFFAIN
ncbi:hypothetical protein [Luteibacter sp.]|uniref:hypothetical protein n=1 Tax=Luteibacter sp. TaxID=1886636 RepID=UPI003F818080